VKAFVLWKLNFLESHGRVWMGVVTCTFCKKVEFFVQSQREVQHRVAVVRPSYKGWEMYLHTQSDIVLQWRLQ